MKRPSEKPNKNSVSKPGSQTVSEETPAQDRISETSGDDRGPIDSGLVSQLLATICSGNVEKMKERMTWALHLLRDFKPKNGTERMLVTQMIATHQAAMECLHLGNTTPHTHAFDVHLRHAEKLLALYTRQVEVLTKLRGQGQQKITVEHVNVQAGGQAVVGNVQAPIVEPSKQSQSATPLALTDQSGTAMPMVEVTTQRPAKVQRRR